MYASQATLASSQGGDPVTHGVKSRAWVTITGLAAAAPHLLSCSPHCGLSLQYLHPCCPSDGLPSFPPHGPSSSSHWEPEPSQRLFLEALPPITSSASRLPFLLWPRDAVASPSLYSPHPVMIIFSLFPMKDSFLRARVGINLLLYPSTWQRHSVKWIN